MAHVLLINHINTALIVGPNLAVVSEHRVNPGIKSAHIARFIYSPITLTSYGALKIYHSISDRFLSLVVLFLLSHFVYHYHYTKLLLLP